MSKQYGGHSMYAPLRRVLVRRPDATFAVDDPAAWHYGARPDLPTAQAEHDALVAILRRAGAEVIAHTAPLPNHADAIFVFDPALITDAGAIILRMGKPLRRGEETAIAQQLTALDMPILATLHGDACAEGGDLLWLDERTLAVGLGFRTNAAGLAQLSAALAPLGVRTLPVELPYYAGPEACLHLLSLISIVDERLAVVEALGVLTEAAERTHLRLREAVAAQRALKDKQLRVFPDIDTAVRARMQAGRVPGSGLQAGLVRLLVERGLREVPGGYVWSSDPRLTLPTLVRMTEAQMDDLLAGIECPTLALFADPPQPYLPDVARRHRVAQLPHGRMEVLQGGHHLHMQQPAQVAGVIAPFLRA